MLTHPTPRLVERLLVAASTAPRSDDETITESGGEADAWAREYPPETITKNDGETDQWSLAFGPRPQDDDTVTRNDGETDTWVPRSASPPRPTPPDDIITLDDGEGDSWA